MKLITAFLLGLWALPVMAQDKVIEPNVKFGEVSLDELQMKFYPKDSTAEAVVLYEKGETNFLRSNWLYTMKFVYHKRIKIFKKVGQKQGDIQVFLRKDTKENEKVLNIQGFTYNEYNNQIIKEPLTREMIFEINLSKQVNEIKFTLPNVKDGSIIEYSYEVKTPFSISPNPNTWYFQSDIPVLWSECKINIPSSLNYQVLLNGNLDINQSRQVKEKLNQYETQGRYVVKNAPAFRSEPFISAATNYISKIDFEVLYDDNYSNDYKSLNLSLLSDEYFGINLSKNSYWENLPVMLQSQYYDSLAQVQAAYNYIKSNMKWSGEMGMFTNDFQKTINERKGNAGEINWMLISLLREMGFDANPVILSTRSHGRIDPNFALIKRFNYVVAHLFINGKNLFLDATEPNLKLGMLPVRCLNHIGFLVKLEGSRLVSLEPLEKDIRFTNAQLKINADGELIGTITKAYDGYADLAIKDKIKELGKEKWMEELKAAKPFWQITKNHVPEIIDSSTPFRIEHEVIVTEMVTSSGDLLYVKPMLTEGRSENPFKSLDRKYPVDFAYPAEESFTATYEIPIGYKVLELPKSSVVSLANNGGKFSYALSVQENKINLVSRLTLRKAVYEAEEYQYLRDFFDKIVSKHNESIVLKRN
ncbi:MAG: DUF3857 domain-containing protein [Spirosomataceae bacterium]